MILKRFLRAACFHIHTGSTVRASPGLGSAQIHLEHLELFLELFKGGAGFCGTLQTHLKKQCLTMSYRVFCV